MDPDPDPGGPKTCGSGGSGTLALSYSTLSLSLVGLFQEEFRKGLSDGSYLELELSGQVRWILVYGGALAGGVQLRALCRHNADV